MTATTGGRKRPRLAFAFCASMFLLPLFYLGGVPETPVAAVFDVTSDVQRVPATPAGAPGTDIDGMLARGAAARPSPTTTAAAAPASGPSASGSSRGEASTAKADLARAPTSSDAATAAEPRSTTTTAVDTTTTTAVRLFPASVAPASRGAAKGRTARGLASWFNAPDGTCAHVTIPIGTAVTVTRLSTGASATCVVDQWGPADSSRIIDLSMDTFEKLATPEAGLIEVLVEW